MIGEKTLDTLASNQPLTKLAKAGGL